MKKKNCIIIHGGGLVDPSKTVLMSLANNLSISNVFETIYIGRYSFEALYTREFWFTYNWRLAETVKTKRGTFFGTARGIDLTEPEKFEKAKKCLLENNIGTIIVCGGDGSSRQCDEINPKFQEIGINIIFPVPLTIDGINGGEAIGIKQATRESVRQIENIVSTSLETRDNEKYGVVMIETQGRNRDDIISNVLKKIVTKGSVADCDLSDILLVVVPANIETNEEELINAINSSEKRTLILVSEGSNIKISELAKKVNRKVRSLVVGHPAQSNDMTTPDDEHEYDLWMYQAASIISDSIIKGENSSFCIVKKDGTLRKESIDYYAKLNPRKNQKAFLSDELTDLLKEYMI